MIAVGTKLTTLAMVKAAIAQGFALKIVEEELIDCGELDEQTGTWKSWSEKKTRTVYEDSGYSVRSIKCCLEDCEIFACSMEEHDEWCASKYPFNLDL